MKGSDAIRIAKRSLVWLLAEERAKRIRDDLARATAAEEREHVEMLNQGGYPVDVETLADLRRCAKSASASAAGYRRGVLNDLQRELNAGVDRPKLKPLKWETAE